VISTQVLEWKWSLFCNDNENQRCANELADMHFANVANSSLLFSPFPSQQSKR